MQRGEIRMSKQSKSLPQKSVVSCTLSFGKYNKFFKGLKKGETKILRDTQSEKNTFIPVKVADDNVYVTEPDGKLIPNIQGQQKCDFLLYCQDKPQTCFVELKGANISAKEKYNPYDQIMDTIKFLQKEDELKCLVDSNTEKHAFIVSPGRQKIPKGVETKERQLWQKLLQHGMNVKPSDVVHYVKVTNTERYSNNGQIICSPKSPVVIPFNK